MNPKPIILIHYLPSLFAPVGEGDVAEVNSYFIRLFPDYHTLAIPSFLSEHDPKIEYLRIQVFYEKDFTEVKYQELLHMIKSSIL